MKTEISTTYYRGHQIDTITTTPEGSQNSYSTTTSEVESSILADNAEDTILTDKSTPSTIRIWATAEAARRAAEQEIEETIGAAEEQEIAEAAYDLANSRGPTETERNATRLAQAIQSLINNQPDQAARALQQIAKNLTQH